jgi:hypothetical protein
MNSDYVTALRLRQHQADLLRQAEEHPVRSAARRYPRESPALRGTARWWRRKMLPNCKPEVAGA